jgi:hypothetical protein
MLKIFDLCPTADIVVGALTAPGLDWTGLGFRLGSVGNRYRRVVEAENAEDN